MQTYVICNMGVDTTIKTGTFADDYYKNSIMY